MWMRRSTRIPRIALTLTAGAALLAACGPAAEEDPTGIDPIDEAIDGDPDAPGDPDDPDLPDSDPPEVAMAVADAAERLDVAPEEVEVVTFESVTWPDGALGCPEPGEMYTQALVEGYRIVVVAQGTELTYHGAADGDPFLCEDPQEPVEGS